MLSLAKDKLALSLADNTRHEATMSDSSSQTAIHLARAVEAIDAQFGEGFARQHPELVASLVQSATIEDAVSTGYTAHRQALALGEKLGGEVCATLLKLKPKFFG